MGGGDGEGEKGRKERDGGKEEKWGRRGGLNEGNIEHKAS